MATAAATSAATTATTATRFPILLLRTLRSRATRESSSSSRSSSSSSRPPRRDCCCAPSTRSSPAPRLRGTPPPLLRLPISLLPLPLPPLRLPLSLSRSARLSSPRASPPFDWTIDWLIDCASRDNQFRSLAFVPSPFFLFCSPRFLLPYSKNNTNTHQGLQRLLGPREAPRGSGEGVGARESSGTRGRRARNWRRRQQLCLSVGNGGGAPVIVSVFVAADLFFGKGLKTFVSSSSFSSYSNSFRTISNRSEAAATTFFSCRVFFSVEKRGVE